jgi:hypothetical protein
MNTTITTPEQVVSLHSASSEDWESIPSGLGARLLSHLLTRSDLYSRRSKCPISEADVVSLSSSGVFGGALAFLIGDDYGRREYRHRWSGSREGANIILSYIALGVSGNRLKRGDFDSSVVRQTDIARAIMSCHAFDAYGGGSPFRSLSHDDIKMMCAEDMGAVASIIVADRSMCESVYNAIEAGSVKSFITEFVDIQRQRSASPIDTISSLSGYVSPCSEEGIHLVNEVVAEIGSRWNPKADRTLRTSSILDREAREWSRDPRGGQKDGWLRMALNYCTEKSPDTLVGWIGQAPCLYEFLNTAAKQRRGVIAARKLIKMMGR